MTPQACIKECPQTTFSGLALAADGQEQAAKDGMREYCYEVSDEIWESMSAQELINEDHCPSYVLPSRSYLGRCMPLGVASDASKNKTESNTELVPTAGTMNHKSITSGTVTMALNALGAFLSVRNFVERILTDIAHTWWMVGVAYIAATLISFVWVVLLRFVAGIMIWLGVGLVMAIFGGLFGYSVYRYETAKNVLENQKNIFEVNFTSEYFKDVMSLADTWLAFSIILGIVFFVILLLLIVLRERIEIAINILGVI